LFKLLLGVGNFGKTWTAREQHERQYTE